MASVIFLLGLLSAFSLPAAAEDFANALQAYLQHRIEAEKVNAGIVVGLVDGHGSRIISGGKLDNGTGQEVNGDTLFEIGFQLGHGIVGACQSSSRSRPFKSGHLFNAE